MGPSATLREIFRDNLLTKGVVPFVEEFEARFARATTCLKRQRVKRWLLDLERDPGAS